MAYCALRVPRLAFDSPSQGIGPAAVEDERSVRLVTSAKSMQIRPVVRRPAAQPCGLHRQWDRPHPGGDARSGLTGPGAWNGTPLAGPAIICRDARGPFHFPFSPSSVIIHCRPRRVNDTMVLHDSALERRSEKPDDPHATQRVVPSGFGWTTSCVWLRSPALLAYGLLPQRCDPTSRPGC